MFLTLTDQYFLVNHYTSLDFGLNIFQLLVIIYLICNIIASGHDEKTRSGPRLLKFSYAWFIALHTFNLV
jgi:hypothetical protein